MLLCPCRYVASVNQALLTVAGETACFSEGMITNWQKAAFILQGLVSGPIYPFTRVTYLINEGK